MVKQFRSGWTVALWAALTVLAIAAPSAMPQAQATDDVPLELQGASIVDMPNALLPLDTVFTDEEGREVRLGDYFNQGKPVLLTMVYFRCPMLCTLVLNGMVDALREIKYSAGDDFTMLTVSFDPLETSSLAALKRKNYLGAYDRAGAYSGWHFLTGSERNTRALADAIGFGYKWIPAQQQYAHQSGIFVVTPDGHLARTLYGVSFDPVTLRGSLLEAGQGHIGTPLDKVYFSCLHFDASSGRYTPSVMNFTRLVVLLITGIMAITLTAYFRHELGAQRRQLAAAGQGGSLALESSSGAEATEEVSPPGESTNA